MAKAKLYETVVLREAIGGYPQGEIGAVVEVYIAPYEAYDIEIVASDGTTKGLIEGVRPEQIAVRANTNGRHLATSLSDIAPPVR